MTYLERAKDFQNMQQEGQTMEAFEKYYAENCTVTEMPTGEMRKGKDAQRKALQEWFKTVQEFHDSGVGAITANEKDQQTMIETWFDITFSDGNRRKMQEVAVQKWDGDEIVEEKFYYHLPGA